MEQSRQPDKAIVMVCATAQRVRFALCRTNHANDALQVTRMFHGRFAHGYTRKDARAILGAGLCFERPVKKSNKLLMPRFTVHGFDYCLGLCFEE